MSFDGLESDIIKTGRDADVQSAAFKLANALIEMTHPMNLTSAFRAQEAKKVFSIHLVELLHAIEDREDWYPPRGKRGEARVDTEL